jgi:hypothetical protein
MTKKNKNIYFYLFFILILILLLINIIIYTINYFEVQNKKNNEPKNINVIIARYKEDLKWTLEEPFNKFKYIVYNKGDNEDFEKTNVVDIIKLENVGRDFHTHFYHIVNNYDNLSDITVFLPGSLELYYKKKCAKHMFNKIIEYNQAVLSLPFIPYINNFAYNYKQTNYTNSSNGNDNSKVFEGHITPFGKWYETYFTNDLYYLSQFGIFSINKNDIIQHEKKRYEKLLIQLSKNLNPEEGFFIEISIYSIFYPFKYTINEIYYNNFIISLPSLIDKFFKFYYKNV